MFQCRNLVEPKKETKILKRDDWPEEPRIPKVRKALLDKLNEMDAKMDTE